MKKAPQEAAGPRSAGFQPADARASASGTGWTAGAAQKKADSCANPGFFAVELVCPVRRARIIGNPPVLKTGAFGLGGSSPPPSAIQQTPIVSIQEFRRQESGDRMEKDEAGRVFDPNSDSCVLTPEFLGS